MKNEMIHHQDTKDTKVHQEKNPWCFLAFLGVLVVNLF